MNSGDDPPRPRRSRRSHSPSPHDDHQETELRGRLHDRASWRRHGHHGQPALERLAFGLEEQAAELILKPLQRQENPLILFDLSQVDYFGSMFLALLIRCWKMALSHGGIDGPFGGLARTRELLRVTSLDIVWPIYDNRHEAMEAFELD